MDWNSTTFVAAGVLMLLLAGCSGVAVNETPMASGHVEREGVVGDCARSFREVDDAVRAASVSDAQSQRIAGFPYLRVNRLLASYDVDVSAQGEFDAWAGALAELDEKARRVELANLPGTTVVDVDVARLDDCRGKLLAHDLSDAQTRSRLSRQAKARVSYSGAKRILGLYPLTSIPMRLGITKLIEETAARFQVPLSELPVTGTLVRFELLPSKPRLTAAQVAMILESTTDNALNMPRPSAEQLDELFQTFAPVWEVDVSTQDDLIGRPVLELGGVAVDVESPSVYTLVSHTRIGAEIALQLNYVIWFPARPRDGDFDLLGGVLDGVTWRVTLARDGQPIFYDAMHNCGCYYMAFPTDRLQSKPAGDSNDEPISMPQRIHDGNGPLVIRLLSASHYLSRIYRGSGVSDYTKVALEWRSYEELQSLPAGNERRSLFASDGIVKGSERGERWLFWPMGIAEPGAMRQWGNHPIAFVGERHFDDPDLIDRHFLRVYGD